MYFTITLSGWDVTGQLSLKIIIDQQDRHNFGHNLHINDLIRNRLTIRTNVLKMPAGRCRKQPRKENNQRHTHNNPQQRHYDDEDPSDYGQQFAER